MCWGWDQIGNATLKQDIAQIAPQKTLILRSLQMNMGEDSPGGSLQLPGPLQDSNVSQLPLPLSRSSEWIHQEFGPLRHPKLRSQVLLSGETHQAAVASHY